MKVAASARHMSKDKSILLKTRAQEAARVRRLKRVFCEAHGTSKKARAEDKSNSEKTQLCPVLSIVHDLGIEKSLVDLSYESDGILLCSEKQICVWRIVRYDTTCYGRKRRDNCSEERGGSSPGDDWPNARASLDVTLSAPHGLVFREAVLSPDGEIFATLTAREDGLGREALTLFCARSGKVKMNIEQESFCSFRMDRRIAFVQENHDECGDRRKHLFMLFLLNRDNVLEKYTFYQGYMRLKSRLKKVIPSRPQAFITHLRVPHTEDDSQLICLQYVSEVLIYNPYSVRLLFRSCTVPGRLRAVLGVSRDKDSILGARCVLTEENRGDKARNEEVREVKLNRMQLAILHADGYSVECAVDGIVSPMDTSVTKQFAHILEMHEGHIVSVTKYGGTPCIQWKRAWLQMGELEVRARPPSAESTQCDSSASTQPPDLNGLLASMDSDERNMTSPRWIRISGCADLVAVGGITETLGQDSRSLGIIQLYAVPEIPKNS